MNNKKIIVCTTFRDFTGSENDTIQKMFLESIENQTYKNYELVVTLFGEKNVEKELEKYNFKSRFYNVTVDDCRYSLTQVLLNSFQENIDNSIILWITCDIILDNNFFEQIVSKTKSNSIGTSHPHLIYSSIKDFQKSNTSKREKLFSGFDLIFFDNSILNEKVIRKVIENYVYKDWGIFEHFLISLNELVPQCSMINLYDISKISKIENDRQLVSEPNAFLTESHKKNSLVFNKFLNDFKISKSYFDLAYCHIRFKNVSNPIGHYFLFIHDLTSLAHRQIKIMIVRLLPSVLKTLFKKFIKGIKGIK
jgi:hypothetical protein